jgi:glycosyltransferase involved in cell wall biosynthesis
MPQLSVIVTCYNIEQYLPQCLSSVLAQTLEDIEVIIVDDGSTDGTPSIIAQYADRDSRIVPVLLSENSIGGVATAANAGLDRATSPYVGFMDGDDYCEPTMFATLLDAAMRHDADLAMCNYRLVDVETGEMSAPADARKWSYLDQEFYVLDRSIRRRFLQFIAVPWRKIYRRAMLEECSLRFPVGDYFFEDNPFHWYTILSARSIAVVPDVLCYHRVAREGQTMAAADERMLRLFDHHWSIYTFLADRDLLDEYAPNLVSWVIGQMTWVSARTPEPLRAGLFSRLSEIMAAHDGHVVQEGLTLSRRGRRAKRLIRAVRANDFTAFCAVLDASDDDVNVADGGRSGDPASRSGLWQAARRRLAGQRGHSQPGPAETAASATSAPGRQPPSIDNLDLLFAMLVLERRLEALDERLDMLLSDPPPPGVR